MLGAELAKRATITVAAAGSNDATFTVEWGTSAAEGSRWTMSGTFDSATKSVSYKNCKKVDYVYDEDGEIESETTVYTGGTGTISFGNGTLTWTDNTEHIADGTTFTFSA